MPKIWKVLAAIAAILLMLLAVTPTGHRVATAAAAPVIATGRLFADGLGAIIRWVLPGAAGKADELQRLRERNAELTVRLAEVAVIRQENDQLRKAANLPRYPDWRAIRAEVITRDPERWQQRLVINRGTADGVVTGAVVLAGEAVLGRVIQANRHNAHVATVLDSQCRFGVGIADSPATGVLLGGTTAFKNGRVGFVVDFLPRDLTLTPQQYVITSGLGGWMPAGLPVGTILPDGPNDARLHVIDAARGAVHCTPIANLDILRFVTILVPVYR